MKGKIDHWWIKGVELVDPYIAASVPISVENPALAYDATNDRFKVDIEAITVGTLQVDPTDEWTRQLGQIDLARYGGAAIGVGNPLDMQIIVSAAAIDPRDRNWTITETIPVSATNLDIRGLVKTQDEVYAVLKTDAGVAYDARDISDNAARLLGIVYGNQDQLQQRATTKELLVQISHQGSEKDPTQIRALTNTDVVSAEQSDETKLKATVTQASSTRTVDDVTKTVSTARGEATSSGNTEIITVSAGKKLRIKWIDIWNNGTASITVYLRLTSTGNSHFKKKLTEECGFLINLVGGNWEGGTDEDLFINLSAAGTISYTIGYEEVS